MEISGEVISKAVERLSLLFVILTIIAIRGVSAVIIAKMVIKFLKENM